MKYKVGDKVKVRKDLVVGKRYGEDRVLINANMEKYFGKIMTVDKITETGKYMLKDVSHWVWTDEMLEDVENITILVKGNKVIAKRGNKVGIARCSPEDVFNIFTGAKVAIERLEEECSWLKEGMSYYYPDITTDKMFISTTYYNDAIDKRMISRCLVFKTREEALEAAKKMLAVLKED